MVCWKVMSFMQINEGRDLGMVGRGQGGFGMGHGGSREDAFEQK